MITREQNLQFDLLVCRLVAYAFLNKDLFVLSIPGLLKKEHDALEQELNAFEKTKAEIVTSLNKACYPDDVYATSIKNLVNNLKPLFSSLTNLKENENVNVYLAPGAIAELEEKINLVREKKDAFIEQTIKQTTSLIGEANFKILKKAVLEHNKLSAGFFNQTPEEEQIAVQIHLATHFQPLIKSMLKTEDEDMLEELEVSTVTPQPVLTEIEVEKESSNQTALAPYLEKFKANVSVIENFTFSDNSSAEKITIPYLDRNINVDDLEEDDENDLSHSKLKNKKYKGTATVDGKTYTKYVSLFTGSFGEVFLSQDQTTGEWIAIKEFIQIPTEKQLGRIKQEVNKLKKHNQLIFFDNNRRYPIIGMKLLEGLQFHQDFIEEEHAQKLSLLENIMFAKKLMEACTFLQHDKNAMLVQQVSDHVLLCSTDHLSDASTLKINKNLVDLAHQLHVSLLIYDQKNYYIYADEKGDRSWAIKLFSVNEAAIVGKQNWDKESLNTKKIPGLREIIKKYHKPKIHETSLHFDIKGENIYFDPATYTVTLCDYDMFEMLSERFNEVILLEKKPSQLSDMSADTDTVSLFVGENNEITVYWIEPQQNEAEEQIFTPRKKSFYNESILALENRLKRLVFNNSDNLSADQATLKLQATKAKLIQAIGREINVIKLQSAMGTVMYLAPEIYDILEMAQGYAYTDKVKVFALGVIIAESLGWLEVDPQDQKRYVIKPDKEIINSYKNTDEAVIIGLLNVIKSMLEGFPHKRSTMYAAATKLDELLFKLAEKQSTITCILPVEDFIVLDEKMRKKIIKAINKKGINVVALQGSQNTTLKNCIAARNFLLQNGITHVANFMVRGRSPLAMGRIIKDDYDQRLRTFQTKVYSLKLDLENMQTITDEIPVNKLPSVTSMTRTTGNNDAPVAQPVVELPVSQAMIALSAAQPVLDLKVDTLRLQPNLIFKPDFNQPPYQDLPFIYRLRLENIWGEKKVMDMRDWERSLKAEFDVLKYHTQYYTRGFFTQKKHKFKRTFLPVTWLDSYAGKLKKLLDEIKSKDNYKRPLPSSIHNATQAWGAELLEYANDLENSFLNPLRNKTALTQRDEKAQSARKLAHQLLHAKSKKDFDLAIIDINNIMSWLNHGSQLAVILGSLINKIDNYKNKRALPMITAPVNEINFKAILRNVKIEFYPKCKTQAPTDVSLGNGLENILCADMQNLIKSVFFPQIINDIHQIKRLCGLADALCQSKKSENRVVGDVLKEKFLTTALMEQCRASAAYRVQFVLTRLLEVDTKHHTISKKKLITVLSKTLDSSLDEDEIKHHFHKNINKIKDKIKKPVLLTLFAVPQLQTFLEKMKKSVGEASKDYIPINAEQKNKVLI